MPNANYRENIAVPGGIGGAITLKGLTQNGTDILVPNKLGSPNQVGGAVLADGSISQTGGSSNIMANVKDTPITAISLQPATPFVTPQASTPTASVGLQTETQSFVNGIKTQAEKQAQTKLEEQKLARDTEANDISSLITGIGGQATKKAEAQQALEPLQEGLDNIISAMEDADLKARRKIEEIQQKNPTGMFGQGGQREIDRINRENASYQADQAIKLSALGRNYDRAKSFIDAKIDAETEGMKAQLEARKFTYENTKDDFTKAEQRKIEADLRNEQRAYDETKANKLATNNIALKYLEEGGDPNTAQKIANATDIGEAFSLTGGIIGAKAVAERIKLQAEAQAKAPITGEWASVINGAVGLVANTKKDTVKNNIANAIANEDYQTAYSEIANAVEDGLTGSTKTKFADARTDIGVLNGMRQAIKDYADDGGDMNLLKGTEEQIKRNLGIDSGKATTLAVQLWREFQTYRSNMTGAAFSAQESRDYASVNPTLGKSLDLNLNVIDGAINQLQNRVSATVNTRLPQAKGIYEKTISQSESKQTAKQYVDQYIKENPTEATKIANLYSTGKYTDEDIQEYLTK